MRKRGLLLGLAAVFSCEMALASDFGQLRRPEVVRAMLLSPDRKAQIRCAIFLTATTPEESGVAIASSETFVNEVTSRLGADIGSDRAAAEEIGGEARRYGAAMDLSVRLTPGAMKASRSVCRPWARALGRDDKGEVARLLGPVPAAPIALPDAADCLAAFRVDRKVRKGNDLSADMIEALEQGMAKAEPALRQRLGEREKLYRSAPPSPGTIEVMAVTCMPALAALYPNP